MPNRIHATVCSSWYLFDIHILCSFCVGASESDSYSDSALMCARFGVQRSLFIRCVMCVDVRCFVIQIVECERLDFAVSTLLPMFCSRRSSSASIICLLTMLLCANIVTSSKLNEWLLTAAWIVAALSSRRNVRSYDFQAYLRSFQCSVDDCYSPCHQFVTRNHTFVPILVFIFHSAEKWADAR